MDTLVIRSSIASFLLFMIGGFIGSRELLVLASIAILPLMLVVATVFIGLILGLPAAIIDAIRGPN